MNGTPSDDVRAAAAALSGALSAEELAHLQSISWATVTPAKLLADDTYFKGLRAVLSTVQIHTKATAIVPRLSVAALQPNDDPCRPNCDECVARIQHAIDVTHNAIQDNLSRGEDCATLMCNAAVLLEHARLLEQLTELTFCLALTDELSPSQADSVVAMASTCRPKPPDTDGGACSPDGKYAATRTCTSSVATCASYLTSKAYTLTVANGSATGCGGGTVTSASLDSNTCSMTLGCTFSVPPFASGQGSEKFEFTPTGFTSTLNASGTVGSGFCTVTCTGSGTKQ